MPRKTVQVVQIVTNLVWAANRDPATGRWIGVCVPLNLNAVGDTWAELQEAANEAMGLLFTDLFEEGELATFLRQNGWQSQGPMPTSGRAPRFDVPVDWNRHARYDELMTARA